MSYDPDLGAIFARYNFRLASIQERLESLERARSDIGFYGQSALAYPAFDYRITKQGSRYIADGGRKGMLRDSSLGDLWLDINAALSRGPAVQFGADPFTVDKTLEVEFHGTVMEGLGPQRSQLTLADGVNDDMIRNKSSNYYYNTKIKGLALVGNDANNTAGRGMEFLVTTATASGTLKYYHWLSLQDLIINDFNDEGLVVQTTGGAHATINLVRFRINQCGQGTFGYPLAFDRVFDSWIGGHRSSVNSMLLDSVTTSCFDNLYMMGSRDEQILLKGGSAPFPDIGGNLFNNVRNDNTNGSALKIDEYQKRNLFANCKFTNFSQAGTTDTHPAVEVTDADALYNMFKDCFFGHVNIKTDDRWKYAFQETQDTYSILQNCITGYGAIDGGNADHFATDEADLVGGSHTTITDCLKGDGAAWGVV